MGTNSLALKSAKLSSSFTQQMFTRTLQKEFLPNVCFPALEIVLALKVPLSVMGGICEPTKIFIYLLTLPQIHLTISKMAERMLKWGIIYVEICFPSRKANGSSLERWNETFHCWEVIGIRSEKRIFKDLSLKLPSLLLAEN